MATRTAQYSFPASRVQEEPPRSTLRDEPQALPPGLAPLRFSGDMSNVAQESVPHPLRDTRGFTPPQPSAPQPRAWRVAAGDAVTASALSSFFPRKIKGVEEMFAELEKEPLLKDPAFLEAKMLFLSGDLIAKKCALGIILFYLLIPLKESASLEKKTRLNKCQRLCEQMMGQLFPEQEVPRLFFEARCFLLESEELLQIDDQQLAAFKAHKIVMRQQLQEVNLQLKEKISQTREVVHHQILADQQAIQGIHEAISDKIRELGLSQPPFIMEPFEMPPLEWQAVLLPPDELPDVLEPRIQRLSTLFHYLEQEINVREVFDKENQAKIQKAKAHQENLLQEIRSRYERLEKKVHLVRQELLRWRENHIAHEKARLTSLDSAIETARTEQECVQQEQVLAENALQHQRLQLAAAAKELQAIAKQM